MGRLSKPKTILVTGGLGFIGSHFIERLLKEGHTVINYDKETYAANLEIKDYLQNRYENYSYQKCDISEIEDIPYCDIIAHLAAESHVDNSIDDSFAFIKTNVLGAYNLLEILKNKKINNATSAWSYKPPLFYVCSTDEVMGDIEEGFFKEGDRHFPSNPYSAAKSCAEQLTVAWGRTYNLPYLITRTTNNYGTRQHPEKLIPRAITNILNGETIPVHGGGHYVRNWIHVKDNVNAICKVLDEGKENEIYHISSDEEYSVKQVVTMICDAMGVNYDDVVDSSMDRSGCDVRYALDCSKIKKLGWKQERNFKDSLSEIILSYKPKRCCKVVAVYFGERKRPPTNGDEMLKHVKFLFDKEQEIDPGVDMDTIFVHNESGYEPGKEYLDSINGAKTKRGKLKVVHRKNEGISFGAYNHVFEKFRNDYDYWFFTEEDAVPIVDYYYKECIDKLISDEKLAYVGVSGLGISQKKLHVHGAVGCSSAEYLGKMYDALGKLPHAKGAPSIKKWSISIRKHLYEGEIEFTNWFVRNGYRVEDLDMGSEIFKTEKETRILLRRGIWKMYK